MKRERRTKARDEVMLLHLLKTFNCGVHKSKKEYNRKKMKLELRKENYDG